MTDHAIREIYAGDQLIAVIIPSDYSFEGIKFFTPDNLSQQLAYMNRAAGYRIEPHVHNDVKREVVNTREVLMIRKGKVRVDFYDNDKKYIESRILKTGDVILFASGGHGFEMIKNTEIIEVKQGPYAGEEDKTRFPGIESSEIRLIDE
jgi:mannose-6-phosphate isomerase-like protein (cupin superfamily)